MKKTLLSAAFLIGIGHLIQAQTIIYVDTDATGSNDGTSWANAYTDLNSALTTNTTTNAQIWVAEGFYTRNANSQTFDIAHDEHIYGGFDGTETSLNQRDYKAHETVISGDTGWNDQGVASSSNTYMSIDNAAHVFQITSSSDVIIDGLTIESAYSTSAAGGGVYVSSNDLNSLIIQNCVIQNNVSSNRAGVLFYSSEVGPEFEFYNNVVENNVNTGTSAYTIEFRQTGSTVNGVSAVAHIVNNLFNNNTSEDFMVGGTCGRFTVIPNASMDVYLTNNTIINNPQGSSMTAPFTYEFSNSNASMNMYINNNVLYNNNGASHIIQLSIGTATQLTVGDSQENVQDFTDFEGYTNTHVVNSSPFLDINNMDLVPITAYQFSGNEQAYLSTYPAFDIDGNDRLSSQGQIGVGAYQTTAAETNGLLDISHSKMSIYPNPTNGIIYITSPDTQSPIELFDISGQLIQEETNSKQIDLSHLNKGTYFIKVGSYTQKLVKQ